MLEAFNHPTKVTRQVEGLQVDLVVDPLSYYSSSEISTLKEELIPLPFSEFTGDGFMASDLEHCIFGESKRGKILTTVTDTSRGIIEGILSGQLLNDGEKPVNFQGGKVFHISVICSAKRNLLKVWSLFTAERPLSRYEGVNDWFYNSLRVEPEKGDLLLLLGKVAI